jgi:hypothetical protein
MTIRSIKWAAGVFAAAVATGPVVSGTVLAQGQMQAVPRAGVSFADTVTVRAKVDTVDTDMRTIAFTRSSDGRVIHCAVSDSVKNLAEIGDDANVDVTYNQIVTILNLRQKGPGSRAERRDGAAPDKDDVEIGRFTVTVTAVDLAANKVSVISGTGGEVRTLAATSIAQKDMLSKIKVGDVVIGLTTPLSVTRIVPVK